MSKFVEHVKRLGEALIIPKDEFDKDTFVDICKPIMLGERPEPEELDEAWNTLPPVVKLSIFKGAISAMMRYYGPNGPTKHWGTIAEINRYIKQKDLDGLKTVAKKLARETMKEKGRGISPEDFKALDEVGRACAILALCKESIEKGLDYESEAGVGEVEADD